MRISAEIFRGFPNGNSGELPGRILDAGPLVESLEEALGDLCRRFLLRGNIKN